jgi:hypothetical protein
VAGHPVRHAPQAVSQHEDHQGRKDHEEAVRLAFVLSVVFVVEFLGADAPWRRGFAAG